MLSIDNLKKQLQNAVVKRDQASQTYQQYVGAIALLSEQIKMLSLQEEMEKAEAQKLAEQERLAASAAVMDDLPVEQQGENDNGEVDQQEPCETA